MSLFKHIKPFISVLLLFQWRVNHMPVDKSNGRSDIQIEMMNQPYSLSYLENTLNRIIGFVNSCDIKASIVLGIFGILFSILLSDSIVHKIFLPIKSAIKYPSLGNIIFLFLLFISVIAILFGLFSLVSTLVARAKISMKDSKIYFVDIANNPNFDKYQEKVKTQGENDVKQDYLSWIGYTKLYRKDKVVVFS